MRLGNKLEVIYKGNIIAGELWVDDNGCHFEYDDAFIEDVSTLPISVNMPKRQKTYHSKELFHYFKSILSEGENREQICKALSIDPNDDWSLLVLTCQYDTIGAITVKTKNMAQCNGCLKENTLGFCSSCKTILFNRSKVSPQLKFNWEDISKRIDLQPMGFSISGVQRKGFIGKPRGIELVPRMNVDEKSQYIIKPMLSRFNLPDQSPANEHVTMQIAKQLFSIKTAECAFMSFANGTPAYITKRFDYDANGGKLNQEDFVSVLKAADKYDSKTYQDVGEWLSPLNRVDFLRILIFNFLTGNGDVHLKNISLLETADGDMMFSPSYDLMNTKIHLTDNLLALNLFGDMEQTNLPLGEKYCYKREDFIEFGKRLKIKETIITKIIDTFDKKENEILIMVDKSFLSDDARKLYKNTVVENYKMFR